MILASVTAILSTLYLQQGLFDPNQGDVGLYEWFVRHVTVGGTPYKDFIVEYPPYALLVFALPWLMGSFDYLLYFMTLVLVLDLGIKLILYVIGRKETGPRAFLPLFLYSVTVPFLYFFILQRFDLWPALFSLVGILLFSRKYFALSGAVLAVAVWLKLYPIVIAIPIFVLAWRLGRWKRFLVGGVIASLPVLVASYSLPWWRFVAFHGERGLQAESLYASVLWMGHFFLPMHMIWLRTNNWYEVLGFTVALFTPAIKIFWAIMVAYSVYVSSKVLWYNADAGQTADISIEILSRVTLFPILAFVVFAPVLSPQYVIWLLPIAVLSTFRGNIMPAVLICVASTMSTLFYPVPNYFGPGLNIWETAALLTRNVLLLSSWILLWREYRETDREKKELFDTQSRA